MNNELIGVDVNSRKKFKVITKYNIYYKISFGKGNWSIKVALRLLTDDSLKIKIKLCRLTLLRLVGKGLVLR